MRRFLFDGHALDIGRRELRRGAEPIGTEPQVFDLLVYLLTNRDRVVSKDDMLNAVWSGRIVSESALTARIAAARRAIGDNGEAQKPIRTVARKGYRFVGEVQEEAGTAFLAENMPARAAESTSLPLPSNRSIAVLAFANMSLDPGDQFFADGLADDIITELSRDRALFVIARNSSFSYRGHIVDVKKIARELGVKYVLEGGVRRERERVRINAQLIDGITGSHVWAERYDRGISDVFAVQDEIAAAVSCAVEPVITQMERHRAMRKPPENLDAWEAYHRGLWHMTRYEAAEHVLARGFFERAIELDPTFSPAYQALAQMYWLDRDMYFIRSSTEVDKLAEPLARKAVALDHADARAHTILGGVLWNRGDTQGALSRLEHALDINRSLALAYWIQGACLVDSGRRPEGIQSLRTYLQLARRDNWNYSALNHIAQAHYLSGDYASAVDVARQAFEANPKSPRSYRWHAAALGQLGRHSEARTVIHQATSAISPQTFDEYALRRMPWLREADHHHMLKGLRKTGWKG